MICFDGGLGCFGYLSTKLFGFGFLHVYMLDEFLKYAFEIFAKRAVGCVQLQSQVSMIIHNENHVESYLIMENTKLIDDLCGNAPSCCR